jgi:hypothetical protein
VTTQTDKINALKALLWIVIAAESCYSQLYPGAEALSETVQHIVDIIEDSK